MTQLIDLGKIRFNFTGDWLVGTTYEFNDVVRYGGNVYVYTYPVSSAGNVPTNTTYWALMIESFDFTGTYNPATTYKIGNGVAYGGIVYICIADTTGVAPPDPAKWSKFVDGIQFESTFNIATAYQKNDVVVHGGTTYIAKQDTTGNAVTNTTYWEPFASGMRWRSAWVTATAYLKFDIVRSVSGTAYIANMDHTSGASLQADIDAGKWSVFAVGSADVLPTTVASDKGKSLTLNTDGSALDWIGATQSDNVFWVAPGGIDDTDHGKNLAAPFATIKYACSQAPAGSTIFVKTGTYTEQLPITIPSNVAIVGDNQRTVMVQPAAGLSDDGVTPNNQATMFLMSDGSILNKMTFKGMTGWVPGTTPNDVTTSTIKGVVVRLNPASPIIHKSPYVLECAAICSGAIGALIDGSVHATGAKTMIFHGYTVISDNGIGYWVKDNGKAEIVSCFTYYCYFGYTASGGGFIRALNGNNSYGTWGATSRGFDVNETPLSGALVGQQLNVTAASGNILVGDTVTASSGGTATVTNVQLSANKIYVKNATGTFTVGATFTTTSGGAGTVAIGGLENQKGFTLVANGFTQAPVPGQSIQIAGDSLAYVIQSVSGVYSSSSSEMTIILAQEKPTGSANGAVVTLRNNYSQIRLTGHDFLNIGTGGTATTNYPGTPTQPPAQGNETDEAFPGRVYYVSTDQNGNFRVGEYFQINQATGRATLNASAFDLAGLTSLRLGSIGAQLGETINEFSSDGTMSGNSNQAVPTEYAVKTYVDARTSVIAGATSILAQTGTSATQQYAVFSNALRAPITWYLTGTVPTGVSINSSTGLLTVASTVSAGTYNSFAVNALGDAGSGNLSTNISLAVNSAVPLFGTGQLPGSIAPSTAFTSTATQATAVTGTVTHSITSGALPSWATLASNGTLSGTSPATPSNTTLGPFSFTVTATNGSFSTSKSYIWRPYLGLIQGQTAYTTPGTYTWVAPTGVTSVSAVCVGGGGAGQDGWANPGGSGGGLGWKNNIPVVPGQSYTVVVGAGGISTNSSASPSLLGGNSYFNTLATVSGYGGGNASGISSAGPNANSNGGGYVGDGGGAGGHSSNWQGGGGAGGYTGRGGNNNEYRGNTGTGGGNGGGSYSSTYGTGAGGGVGILGQGPTGYRFYTPFNGYETTSGNGGGGEGGSGGSNGMYGENPFSGVGESSSNIQGGTYGGGGGGPGTSWPNASGNGGNGAVRIIWGSGRAYPATNTGDVTPSGPA